MIKHNEIEIPEEKGKAFDNCQLDRKKYADVLTNIVSSYADGFVLAINNKWGTGKTTFIRMWERDLKDKGFKTVLFNAWENDFENNALTALMGELKTLTKVETEQKFKEVLKNGAVLSKNILPTLVGALSEKYIGKDIKELAENITKGVADIFEKDVNEYANKKKSIKDFRDSLKEFIANTWDGKPVVFIIDELDRCRPDYAVSILEQIKHFFSIPQIVFVLSIDKEQLGHAVRGVYGSEFIDAGEYLRRFIDIEYSIPEPDIERYIKYLFDYYDFNNFLNSDYRMNSSNLKYDSNDFYNTAKIILKSRNITLRQLEKIFAHSRLGLRLFDKNSYVFPSLFFYLNFIKILDSDLYYKIKEKKLSIEDLQEKFIESINYTFIENDNKHFIILEIHLVYFYHNYIYNSNYNNAKQLFEKDPDSNNNKLLITSKTDKSSKHSNFLKGLEAISFNFYDIDLEFLFSKIDLLENFKE